MNLSIYFEVLKCIFIELKGWKKLDNQEDFK